jgi:hypothetical protein
MVPRHRKAKTMENTEVFELESGGVDAGGAFAWFDVPAWLIEESVRSETVEGVVLGTLYRLAQISEENFGKPVNAEVLFHEGGVRVVLPKPTTKSDWLRYVEFAEAQRKELRAAPVGFIHAEGGGARLVMRARDGGEVDATYPDPALEQEVAS